ncbi:MAG: CRISPR-associated endonuclease Cas2 [Arcobacteraceae bacterium]|jgi:CRISPR-associated protein Cas2|nr:CRISPR-associated endonuclease Cas2 [Arcobacteraceae bacterium]
MSAFRIMWLMLMFDLPTKTKKDKKKYHWFHDELEKEGYMMLQYSVYGKIFSSVESANLGKKRIKEFVNKNIKSGNIRMLMFTDKQFASMDVIIGEKSEEERNEPVQLLLF